ncbi:MAG: hypothetical protein ACTSQZ_09745 [Candidatus Thorarchaeota archaeon]
MEHLAWGFEATNEAGVFAFRLDKKILAVRDQFRVSVGNYMDPLHAIASALVVDRVFFKGKHLLLSLTVFSSRVKDVDADA